MGYMWLSTLRLSLSLVSFTLGTETLGNLCSVVKTRFQSPLRSGEFLRDCGLFIFFLFGVVVRRVIEERNCVSVLVPLVLVSLLTAALLLNDFK